MDYEVLLVVINNLNLTHKTKLKVTILIQAYYLLMVTFCKLILKFFHVNLDAESWYHREFYLQSIIRSFTRSGRSRIDRDESRARV